MAATTIPFEILRDIFSYLSSNDLANVSLVSPHWHASSREALYQAPTLFPVSLMLFLRTIITPGLGVLGTYVRNLTVKWQSFHAEPILRADLPLFHAAAEQHGLSEPRTLTNEFVELLLHLLPHVQVLNLSPLDTPSHSDVFLGATPTCIHLPLALRSVRDLSCTWISNYRGVNSAMLLTMLKLPNIRTLEVHVVDEISPHVFQPATIGSSGVSKLNISYSQISMRSLTLILAVPRALKHLVFCSTISAGNIDLGEFYRALAPLQPSLQALEVQLDRGDSWGSSDRVVLWQGETFVEWPLLRGLRCPIRLLLGDGRGELGRRLWAVLPRGICDLTVSTDRSWKSGEMVEEFCELLYRKAQAVPLLRTGKVRVHYRDEPIAWEKIRELCKLVDVELLMDDDDSLCASWR